MNEPAPEDSTQNRAAESTPPLVISLCGTFLKPEMQSIYRQVTGLTRFRTTVYTERESHREQFPFEPVVVMEKRRRPRPRGNFLLRFWYKYVVRQWPPPRPINKLTKPYYPYNLPDLLAADNPALVHVYYGHKAVKYRKMLKAWGGPWIVSFHGVDVAKYTDGPGYTDALHKVFAEASLVLARSESLLKRLTELGCPPEKARLNRTPLPLDKLPVFERTLPTDGTFRLLQASRLIAKKGLFTTLEALALLKPEFPRLQFILCGEGPDKDRLLQTAADKGLTDMIQFAGWLDQENLRRELAAAHLFLHPSETTAELDQEGVPNSMLEAMATGLPVVATHHGGIPEAVTHRKNGLLVPEKSPAELANAIRSLLNDGTLWQTLAHNAAQNSRAAFGAPASLTALEDAYTEAIQTPATP